ncbi:hypothetical protein ACJX0J_022308, partial [Zea mays]
GPTLMLVTHFYIKMSMITLATIDHRNMMIMIQKADRHPWHGHCLAISCNEHMKRIELLFFIQTFSTIYINLILHYLAINLVQILIILRLDDFSIGLDVICKTVTSILPSSPDDYIYSMYIEANISKLTY